MSRYRNRFFRVRVWHLLLILATLSCVGVVACSVMSKRVSKQPPVVVETGEAMEADATVFITASGHRYHRGDCVHLKTSKFEVKLSEAKRKYTACVVCRPTEED